MLSFCCERKYTIVRTWEDYKKDVKDLNQDIEEMEVLATIVSTIIEKRNDLGISQRGLADICGLPHSSVARIESCAVKPKVETLIKIMKPLGLRLSAVSTQVLDNKTKTISLLKPIGHCFGVLKAIEIAKKTKEQYLDKNVYVFGLLVHNEEVVKELDKLGIKTIEMNEETAATLLNKFTSNDVVIFTAHGHPQAYEDILKKNNVTYIDATCSKVKDCFNVIKEADEVIYIGKNHHPETVAALTMNSNAHLYDISGAPFDYSQLKSDHPLVINQTTLSFLELEQIHTEIKNKLPRATFYNEICNATLLRQQAIKGLNDDVDTIIIVGSKKSSNTMKLYDLAKSLHPNKQTILVNNVDELKGYQLTFKSAVIASGTSTSIETINQIKVYLNSF